MVSPRISKRGVAGWRAAPSAAVPQVGAGDLVALQPLGHLQRERGLGGQPVGLDRVQHHGMHLVVLVLGLHLDDGAGVGHPRHGGRHLGLGPAQQVRHDLLGVAVDQLLPAHGDGAHEVVLWGDEPVLHEDADGVPVDDPGVDPEHVEGPDEAAVADGGRALHHAAALGSDVRQQTGALVEVDAGEVHLPQVARVVHVVQQHVDVGCQADPFDREGVQDMLLLLAEQADDDGQQRPGEVVELEEQVQQDDDAQDRDDDVARGKHADRCPDRR